MNLKKIERATRLLLEAIGDTEIAESTLETPGRVARAYREMLSGYLVDIGDLFSATENGYGGDQLVIARDIKFTSWCCHHVLPFETRMAIGYLPRDRVIGISKIGRLARAYGQRLQLQERLTKQVANALMQHLEPLGVAVVSQAEHQCMRCRGVKLPDVSIVVSEMLGAFRDNYALRAEFLALSGMTK